MGSLLFPRSWGLQVIALWVFHASQPSWIFLSHQLLKLMSREWAYLHCLILCCSSGSFGSRNSSKDECATLGLASFPSFLGMRTEGMVSPESESYELLLSLESVSMIALLATLPSGTSLLMVSL